MKIGREAVVGELGERLDAYLTGAARFGFSGQVLVAKAGEIVLHRAYGWASPEERSPLSVATPIGVASMSKRFAAVAVLRLVSDGKLALDARLGDLLPAVPEDKRGLTVRQVLTHSAGLRGGYREDFGERSRDATVERLLREPLVAEPGKQWRYSTEGYNLIAAIVDRVAGEPYEEFVARAVFAPLGLASTGFWSAPAAGAPPAAPARVGLRASGSPARWPRNWGNRGGGDVVSTAADIYRAHLGLASNRALPATLARSTSETQFEIEPGVAYGFGTMLASDERGAYVEWAGDTELGYNGVLFDYPAHGVTAVVLSPARDAFGRSLRQLVQAEVLALAFGAEVPPYPDAAGLDAAQLDGWAGTYPLRDGALDLFSDGAQLWMAPRGGEATRVLLEALGAPLPGASAEERTARLLAALHDGDLAGFDEALGEAGRDALAEYQAEWRALVSEEGAMREFSIVGASARRGSVAVLARLELRDRARTMRFTWADDGRGRLAGTSTEAFEYPLLLAAARSPRGGLTVCEAWRVRCFEVERLPQGGLRLAAGDAVKAVTGPPSRAGWQPAASAAGRS